MTRSGLTKTAFIAAAIVASSVFAMQPNQANAGISINLNLVAPAPGPGAAPPPQHRPAPRPHRLSCNTVRKILRQKHGFRNVQAYDCKGKSYWFVAFKHGHRFRVKTASTNGQIIQQFPG